VLGRGTDSEPGCGNLANCYTLVTVTYLIFAASKPLPASLQNARADGVSSFYACNDTYETTAHAQEEEEGGGMIV